MLEINGCSTAQHRLWRYLHKYTFRRFVFLSEKKAIVHANETEKKKKYYTLQTVWKKKKISRIIPPTPDFTVVVK